MKLASLLLISTLALTSCAKEAPPATEREGEPVKREMVSDWLAIDDNKLVGGFTLRVQRERMTPGQRAKFDATMNFVIED